MLYPNYRLLTIPISDWFPQRHYLSNEPIDLTDNHWNFDAFKAGKSFSSSVNGSALATSPLFAPLGRNWKFGLVSDRWPCALRWSGSISRKEQTNGAGCPVRQPIIRFCSGIRLCSFHYCRCENSTSAHFYEKTMCSKNMWNSCDHFFLIFTDFLCRPCFPLVLCRTIEATRRNDRKKRFSILFDLRSLGRNWELRIGNHKTPQWYSQMFWCVFSLRFTFMATEWHESLVLPPSPGGSHFERCLKRSVLSCPSKVKPGDVSVQIGALLSFRSFPSSHIPFSIF